MNLVHWMDRRFYPEFEDNWDDLYFMQKILEIIQPEYTVLDLGAGAGIVKSMNFRGQVRMVCGVDVDPRVLENPYLDEAAISDAASLPFQDDFFDLVFADNVMEHLDDTQGAFREISRVLRPGGLLVFKTPNKNHYMPLIARASPHWFHAWVSGLRGRSAVDTFPTRYRCNSSAQLQRLAIQTGLAIDDIEFIEGRPEYMRINPITYCAGLLYERLVNLNERLAGLRVVMIASLSKPAER